jgi:hypothetical protein
MTFHHKNIESSNASVSNAFDSIFMQIKKAKPDLCTPPQISSNMCHTANQSPEKQDAMKIQQDPDAVEEVDGIAAEEASHSFMLEDNIRRS